MSMNHAVISPKKLIEVALPLDAINMAAAKEKSIRQGHPCSLHLWWARRPLAAARAVIFSQLVNDPEDLWQYQNPGKEPNAQVKGHWTKARARLFTILEDLVEWENTTNETVLEAAREEIRKSWRESCALNKHHPQAKELFNPDRMPGLHDPFAGGGAIPLEAQRLGLNASASDLNPVAVVINKAMIEIPPKFAGQPPVGSKTELERKRPTLGLSEDWRGAKGLAEDVRRYGLWMCEEACKRIGHLYPPVEVTKEVAKDRPDLKQYVGEKLTVIAWLWARTVKSPNPAFSKIDVPLVSTFMLCTKAGKEAYIEPVIENGDYRFTVKMGKPKATESAENGTKLSGGHFRCLFSGVPIPYEYIDDEANSDRMNVRLMAIVAEGKRGRVYLPPSEEVSSVASTALPTWKPDAPSRGTWASNAQGRRYGFETFGDYFTARQLVALTTLSDLVQEARQQVKRDAIAAELADDGKALFARGTSATAYADAVAVYLGIAVDKAVDYNSSICRWIPGGETLRNTFGRQALPMVWDFCESNILGSATGSIKSGLNQVTKALEVIVPGLAGAASQCDAQSALVSGQIVSTDPPYFNNIGYADLSDFFYVWLRRALRPVFPDLFATVAVPKDDELVACSYRHGSQEKAESFFLCGMTQAMKRIAEEAHPAFPVTIYYAFKQAESDDDHGTTSSGWDTFLDALIRAGFAITGTWPMRTERGARSSGSNTLASSIILVCRKRAVTAESISRRLFIRELNATLPIALDAMTRESEGLHSPVAPVDLSQAIIGPGMAVFSNYTAVLEAGGSAMTVRTALQLINRFLAEDDFDSDTQFCLHWFEQYGWESGKFGEADTLARAKGTSVDGVKQADVLHAVGGNVRLLKWSEYASEWDPQVDQRLPIWEVLHQLIRVFNTDGETGAATVFAAVQSKAEAARQLAYRLYTLCERKNWAEDARAYNEVVTSWSGIESAASKEPALQQGELF